MFKEKSFLMNQINQENNIQNKLDNSFHSKVSLETELSESLYEIMKDFVLRNPTWDQYKPINSALATFLVQNSCMTGQFQRFI